LSFSFLKDGKKEEKEKVVSDEITVLALILAQIQGINAVLNINLDMAYIKYPSKLEQKVVPFKSISVGYGGRNGQIWNIVWFFMRCLRVII
jgi:hypothetical protein